MLSGQAATGIAVMHQPVVPIDVIHEHHHVMIAHGHHSRSWRGTREFPEPVRSQIELGTDPAEQIKGRFAATKSMRATRRPAADHRPICVGYGTSLHGAVCIRHIPSLNNMVGTAALIALNRAALAVMVTTSGRRISGCNKSEGKKRSRKYRCVLYHLASTCQKRFAPRDTCSH